MVLVLESVGGAPLLEGRLNLSRCYLARIAINFANFSAEIEAVAEVTK